MSQPPLRFARARSFGHFVRYRACAIALPGGTTYRHPLHAKNSAALRNHLGASGPRQQRARRAQIARCRRTPRVENARGPCEQNQMSSVGRCGGIHPDRRCGKSTTPSTNDAFAASPPCIKIYAANPVHLLLFAILQACLRRSRRFDGKAYQSRRCALLHSRRCSPGTISALLASTQPRRKQMNQTSRVMKASSEELPADLVDLSTSISRLPEVHRQQPHSHAGPRRSRPAPARHEVSDV
jgi:hypothetical protein